MAQQILFQPLLLPTTSTNNTTSSSSNSGLLFRVLSIILVGAVSLWANCETSKGFEITIINDSTDTHAAKMFKLFYESNDEATRVLHNTSQFVENVLYRKPRRSYIHQANKKQPHGVTLRLTTHNSEEVAVVNANEANDEFVITLNSSIMYNIDFRHAIISALQRAMAQIWLWDGRSMQLVDGMVEYITMLAGFHDHDVRMSYSPIRGKCCDDKNPMVVAYFLSYCERQSKGFVRRLNEEMRSQWHDRKVEIAVRVGAEKMCDSYKKVRN